MKNLLDGIGAFLLIVFWYALGFGLLIASTFSDNVANALCLILMGIFVLGVGTGGAIKVVHFAIAPILISLSLVFFTLSYVQTNYPEMVKIEKTDIKFEKSVWRDVSRYLTVENNIAYGYYTGAAGLGIGGLFLFFGLVPDIGRKWKHKKEMTLMRQNFDKDIIDDDLLEMIGGDTQLMSLLRADPDLPNKIQATMDLYNPNAGTFSSWWRRIRSESRTKTLDALNNEQQALIKQAALFEEQVLKGQKDKVEFKMFLARNAAEFLALKTQAKLSEEAYGKGMLVEDYSGVNKEKELSEIYLQEETTKFKLEQEKERYLQELRIKEYEAKSKLDQSLKITQSEYVLEKTREQSQQKRTVEELKQDLKKAIIERDKLAQDNDLSEETKQKLLAVEDRHIQSLEKQLNDRYTRLV